MKLHGKKIEGANVEYVVIPRSDGDLVFKATAVLNRKDFDRLCPMPKPPKVTKPGGKAVDDPRDPEYLEELNQYEKKDWAFTFLWSLRDTPGLEWETVDYNDSSTWNNYEQELRDAGFTTAEINHLSIGVGTANSLNPAKIDEAKRNFLATLTQLNEQSSQKDVQPNTSSGEPVNALV